MEEKSLQVDSISVNYKIAGEGPVIFILHGWGSSSDSWTEVQKMLVEKGYQVIVPDLPGFGKTAAPPMVWGVGEYAEFVNEFIDLLTLKVNKSQKVVLVGHSFGGQTAIQFAVTHSEKVEKLVLVAAAGVRRTPGVFKKLVAGVAKTASFILYLVPSQELRMNIKNAMYMAIRRRDYVRTQGIMRDIFKKVITQDLTAKFSKISVPALIIWGDKDELTPVQDAYLMDELIPNSKLEIIKDGKHALNFQFPKKLEEIMRKFLNS
jgi:pimeloyl-ACP methyl ester carboxylesterase